VRLIEEIDCKLVTVGNDAYNELIFRLNNVCNDTKLFALLTYRRILVARLANEIDEDDYVYASDFCLDWIVSKVKLLTVGCVVGECCIVRTTVVAPVCLPFEVTALEVL
jgi:hypothetical protein